MSKRFESFSTPNGAYIHAGVREYQFCASIPHSDALEAVIEGDPENPGTCYTYFIRGGFAETRMSYEECLRGAEAMIELVKVAGKEWNKFFYKNK